jgi:hypothetical protein
MNFGVRCDQAGIDGEPFAADKPFGHAASHDGLEQVAQNIAVAESAMTVAREGRMIGYSAIEPQAAEPAVGQVQMDLFTQAPFGPDAPAVPNDKHPDH